MLMPKMRTAILLLVVAVMVGCSGSGGDSVRPVYRIEGEPMELDVDGMDGILSVRGAVIGDLDGDGQDDLAVVLNQRSRGTGSFYYLNVFLGDGDSGWQFIGEEFLGDRIKFDFIDIYAEGSVSQLTGVPIHPDDYGQLVVAYAIHTVEQSFVEEPGNYLTGHWEVADGALVKLEPY